MSVSFHATFQEQGAHSASFKESNDVHAEFDAEVDISGGFPSDDIPLMDGVANPGVGRKYSRSDHVHPRDSEKMDYMSAITNLELEAMLT